MQSHISRRGVLKGAAAVAGLGALGAFPAFGQADKKIVLSTWGGDYAKLLTKHISAPVLAPQGLDGGERRGAGRAAQGQDRRREAPAEGHVRRAGADRDRHRRADRDRTCWRSSTCRRLKNAKNIIKTFSIADSPLFSPHIYSGKVVLYNPKLIKDVPKGMDALWDPKNQGKVGIVDIQHVYTTMAAALVGGRQDRRLRQGQEGAARAQEAEAAHLSEQRGAGPGAADRGGRPVHHVEGARGAMAERGHQHPDRRAQGRPHQPTSRDSRFRRTRRTRPAPMRSSTRRWRRRPRKASPSTWATTRWSRNAKVAPDLQGAHRLHARRGEAAGQPGPRVPGQARWRS